MSTVKKVAAIHDLSGYGRASLTIAIPVISAMGIQVCPLPTAVLSTQTLYSDYKMVDLTHKIAEFGNHWHSMGLKFDSIFSGFLASKEQVSLVIDFIKKFKTEDNLVVVDPVMGDDGKRFGMFGDEFVAEMRSLVAAADMITPNFTEAGLLLDHKDELTTGDVETAKKWARELAEWGIKTVVITSVPTTDGQLCTMAYDRDTKEYYFSYCKKYPVRYSGTGDTYTSVLVGSMLRGEGIARAMDRATAFLTECIKDSYENHPGEIEFTLEPHLHLLAE